MVHSYLVDMLLFCQHEKEENTEDSLDISHVMWSELVSVIFERKCPIYGPFIMFLIEKAWERVYPRVVLETRDLVSHEIKRLRKKEDWGTTAPSSGVPPGAAGMETEADADDDDDYEPSGAEPSWAKKLKRKMKKLLCMESHSQYMTHVAEKQARSHHKELMRQLGANVASGSEGKITDEEEWVQQHYPWTNLDTDQFPTDDGSADDPAGM